VKPDTSMDLNLRLRTIEGHVRGIRMMVDGEGSCASILQQVLAVQRSLDAVTDRLIDDHVDICLGQLKRAGGKRSYESAVRQLGEIYDMGRLGAPLEGFQRAMEETE
jgi:DNA-binding FrmR family transcriptional regulator